MTNHGRAVIYARFSCSRQREASIEDQLRVCTEWCSKNGYEVVAEYCDRAASGRSDDRPEFQRMIANAGESDIVLVYMMDRFSRDIYDAPIYKKRLKDHGVRVVSATESMPDGPESMLLESIYEAMAAMESAHISQRVRRGMEGNAIKCMHNGVTLYGYDLGDDGYYKVNDGQAELVREMFARRLAGENVNSIAADMARKGVKTKMGNPCNYMMVAGILKNEKYAGTYKFGGTVVDGGMPAIVTREVFDMVQLVRSKKVRGNEQWGDFAFSGKGICYECGHSLVGVSGRGRHNVKYEYYRCSKKCGCHTMRADVLESMIACSLRDLLESRETALEIANFVSKVASDQDIESQLKEARNALSAANKGISNIMRAVEAGMDYADVADRLAELKLERTRAESEVKSLSQRVALDVEDFADFLQHGTTLDDRALLDAFVYQVWLGEKTIVAVLNYDIQGEPARLEWQRGFVEEEYGGPRLYSCEPLGRVMVAYFNGCVILSMPRSA